MPYGHPTKHTLILPTGDKGTSSHVFDTREQADLYAIDFAKSKGRIIVLLTINDNEAISIYGMVSLLMSVGFDKFFGIVIPPQSI